jgi:hypothetical protein
MSSTVTGNKDKQIKQGIWENSKAESNKPVSETRTMDEGKFYINSYRKYLILIK